MFPWWARIGAKLVLSRVPLGYSLWRRVNVFKHGEMLNAGYAAGVLRRHLQAAGPLRADFVLLEMGPGDSVLNGVLGRLSGASRSYLVDAGAFATRDLAVYRRAVDQIGSSFTSPPSISPEHWRSFEDMLQDCRITYRTNGLAALRELPADVVDLSFSQAVLEHVRRDEFGATMQELRRIARAGGASTHQVDLQDHLGGRLDNLRVSPRRWEGAFFSSSGFYTNRLRCSEILALARAVGFEVRGIEREMWGSLPTPRQRMDELFREWPDEELRIMHFFLTLRAP